VLFGVERAVLTSSDRILTLRKQPFARFRPIESLGERLFESILLFLLGGLEFGKFRLLPQSEAQAESQLFQHVV
jgi:hypothetical protein